MLKPLVEEFCEGEILFDTKDFLKTLGDYVIVLSSPGMDLFTLDVKGLYPSMNTDYMEDAVMEMLDLLTDFCESKKIMIAKMVQFSINNSIVHYRDDWYVGILGLTTGNSDSVPLANLFVRWVIKLFHEFNKNEWSNTIALLKRFIDDLFGGWKGTRRQFDRFVNALNSFGKKYGIQFDSKDVQYGDSVNFLDVTVYKKKQNQICTRLYSKPTDAHRYLHRKSYHPQHTFKSVPFSQMRRARLICSEDDVLNDTLLEMNKYFENCGYDKKYLLETNDKVLRLNRAEMLTNEGKTQ